MVSKTKAAAPKASKRASASSSKTSSSISNGATRTRSKTAGAKAPTYLVQAMARRPLAELEQERKELQAMVVDTNNRKVMMDSAFESLIKKTTLQKKEATEKVDRFLKTASKKIAVLDAAIQRAGA